MADVDPEAFAEAAATGKLGFASELAEPEDDTPPPPNESDPRPPGEYVGPFRVDEKRFPTSRPSWGVDYCHSDGTMEPLGVWIHREWKGTGPELADWLQRQGLDQTKAVWYGRQRQNVIDKQVVIDDTPGVKSLKEEEAKHFKAKDEFAKAYLAAQKKKGAK